METLIHRVRYFNGSQEESYLADVVIAKGKIVRVSQEPLVTSKFQKVILGKGQWMLPGFIDTHTHYDAEVLVSPGLKESVRHGVTTSIIGCCSLSMVCSEPEDCSDFFTRVEAIPREVVLPILHHYKKWKSPKEYVRAVSNLPLGPNLATFLGHSDLRVSVLGLANAVNEKYQPTENEYRKMENVLEESLTEGFVGMSMMTTKWDKLDGDRFRSKPLPSTFSSYKEFTRLSKILRKAGRILQGAPDIVTKVNMFYFLWQSMGLFGKKLKITLITLADTKANPLLYWFVSKMTNLINKVFKADFRWQALPCEFKLFADGMDLVIFEEFGAGEEALHIANHLERKDLINNPDYRKRFIKDYDKKFSPRVWHRNFGDSKILNCPNDQLIGKSFGDLAVMENIHPVEAFLNTVAEYGKKLQWSTTIANHRKKVLEYIINQPSVIISFSDAGAHLRNMAFYNFSLQLLKLVHDSHLEGRPIMSLEKAVWRLTGELGDWFQLDAGYIREGDRADFLLLDPSKLNDSLFNIEEVEFPEFDHLVRLVNRHDGVIEKVFINGEEVFDDSNGFHLDYEKRAFGTFLKAQ